MLSAVPCATVCCPAGTSRESCGSPTPQARLWPPASPVLTPCRPSAKCGPSWRSAVMLTDRIARMISTRVHQPEQIAEAAAARKRAGSIVDHDGRLVVIAADHPARGALGVGGERLAMADRGD